MTRSPSGSLTPLWLSHHFPEHYDRCAVIAGRHICRRCLVLYPLAFVVMGLGLAGVHWPPALDPVALWLLPLPAVVEFVLEHRGVLAYHPVRQVLLTIPLALGLGRGFTLYLQDPGSRLFWSVVVVYGGLCLAAALLRRRPEGPSV
ncbi:hypothetical protein [Rhabdothermincola sp.]|uniref:hypothetical protein n=1 Tax=Rhabdothermincola sp. TaxID=2820405 RepID=UPI002FE20D48